MLTKDIKQTIDNARNVLVGKIPNPQSQIEQITIAMIYKFMDDMDIESVELGGKREFFVEELEQYAWSKIMSQQLGNQARMNLYTEALDKLQLSNRIPKLFRDIFKGAYLPFRDGQTLTLFLKEINDLSYNDSESLGDGFEYLLSIMGSQGDAGQFRTPRHIIDFIVDVVKPTKTDRILDPACGTAGFLISAYKYILKVAQENKQNLTPKERKALTENIQGYDISPDMVKLALVNMYLHKFKEPKIYEYDTLTEIKKWDDYFDCILANPPFMTPKGGIQPHNKFAIKANRSEVLFVDYIMEHLNSTGRAGIIVPEGIVFQSANAYKQLRKELIDGNYLYAVVSLPSGIFNPYSGVKTSILFIDKTLAKKTDKILFVEIQNDGFDLGAQRRQIDKNDLPKALELINSWQDCINTKKEFKSNSTIATVVGKTKLAENEEYNLTASRYKETKDYSNCKWDMVKLGDVCDFQTGSRQKGGALSEGIPSIGGEQININGHINIDKMKYISKEYYASMSKGILQNFDVLLVKDGATTGKTGIYRKEFREAAINEHVFILRAKSNILPIYLYNVIKSNNFQDKLKKYIKGIICGISLEVKDIEIPLPPIEIQEQIVKELDGYQAVIDGAQKVIDNWKPTFQINPNWQKVKLGDVCEKITDGSHFSPETSIEGYPYITVKDITLDNKINFNHCKYIDKKSFDLLKKNGCKPSVGDVLFSKDGTVGKTALVEDDIDFVVLSSLAILTPKESIVERKYLFYYVSTDKFIKDAVDNKTGIAIKRIVLKTLKDLYISIPSLSEQKDIIEKIEQEEKAIEECKKLIKIQQEKINSKLQSIWGENE